MFCNHDDEVDAYGSEPVPCPFCGLGARDQASTPETREGSGFEDSNDALRHALFETDTQGGSSDLTGYW